MTSYAGQTLSHYKVLHEIGRGGMGVVYRALDLKLNREVALKVLPPELVANPERRRRFIQEAQAAASLADPRIVVVHEIDEADGVTFIAMELVSGEKLGHVLDKGRLPLHRALDVAIEMAEGLARAHHKGVVHRDFKPANVVMTEDGHVKIIDFGLAKLVEPLQSKDHDAKTASHLHTSPGTVLGTVAYMSPEQVRGLSLDHRTDIFSFGIVLHEMLAGRSPFQQPSAFDTQQAIVTTPAPRLASDGIGGSLTPRLQALLDKCLAKQPEERYQDMNDALVDLRSLRLAAESGVARTAPALARALRRPSQRVLVVAAGLVLTMALLAVAFKGWRRDASGPRAIRSIVALPSRVHAAEADQFLTDAIPTTLSTHLSQIEGLETKLPPTSTDLERVGSDLGKLAELYRVSAFVTSSAAVEAGRLTLIVQLVEAGSRRLVWSKQYEGSRSGYPQMVREAAEGLGRAVRPTAPQVRAAAVGEAELLVQRGRYHMSRYGALYQPEDARRALEAFEKALELDPGRSDAAAAAAVLFARKAQIGDDEAQRHIETWARRALELDPRSSQAWNALSYAEYRWGRSGSRIALEYSLKSSSFGPREPLPQAQFGQVLMDDSCVLALEGYNEAARLDPLYFNAKVSAVGTLELLGRMEEAQASLQQILRAEPDAPLALLYRARWLTRRREEQDALFTTLESVAQEKRIHPGWLTLVRDLVTVERGEKDAGAALDRVLKVAGGASRFPAWDKFALLGVAFLARERRPADALEILVGLGQSDVAPPYDMLTRNPHLAFLKTEPKLQTLLARSRGRFETTLALLEAARTRGELPPYLEKPLAELRAGLK